MIDSDKLNNLVWAERYRPKTLDDAILPDSTKTMVRDALSSGNVPHFLFCGTAGTGKTTLAKVIANELGADLLYINASLTGIDSIRMNVIQFASSVSFGESIKIVLFDEFDGASVQSQQSMRGIIEEFPNTRFFFTCNFKNKIIEAIHSRCVVVDFKISKEEAPKIQGKFFKRVLQILDVEKVEYDKPAIAELVKKNYPDFRKTLNELQRYGNSGKIDAGILLNANESNFKELITYLKDRNFTEMRKWVGSNSDIEFTTIIETLYSQASDLLEPKCIPNVVIILGEYMYKCSVALDQEILIAAMLTHLMGEMHWK